jgi:hypothetical protein
MTVSSYDRNARRPRVGSHWVWEIDHPSARELVEILEVKWNGEEWWVKTKSLMKDALNYNRSNECWNDLSRFWEASSAVAKPRP